MSPLKGIVETLDDVEEPYRELYKESDKGGYRLDAEGIEFAPDVEALKSKARSEARIRQNLEKEVAKFPKDFDREKWEEWVALYGENGSDAPNGDEPKGGEEPKPSPNGTPAADMKKIRDSLEARYKDQLTERDKRIEEFETREKTRAINDTLSKGIDEIGITDPIYRRAVTAMMKEQGVEATLEDGDYRIAIKDPEFGEMVPVAKYLKEWAKKPEAEAFLPASGATGGGATGSAPNTRPGTIRSKADFKSQADRLDYIDKHGSDKYLALPGKADPNLR